jgi:hypothetical protein
MAILAETCSVLRTFKNFKSFTNFKCECEELISVCTQDKELIVIEWTHQLWLSTKHWYCYWLWGDNIQITAGSTMCTDIARTLEQALTLMLQPDLFWLRMISTLRVCLATAGHKNSFSCPHFLHVALSKAHTLWRCHLNVQWPVSIPVTSLRLLSKASWSLEFIGQTFSDKFQILHIWWGGPMFGILLPQPIFNCEPSNTLWDLNCWFGMGNELLNSSIIKASMPSSPYIPYQWTTLLCLISFRHLSQINTFTLTKLYQMLFWQYKPEVHVIID